MTLNFNFNSRVNDHIYVFKMFGSRMEAKLAASKFKAELQVGQLLQYSMPLKKTDEEGELQS